MANETLPTEETITVINPPSVNHTIYLWFTIVLFFIGLFGNIMIIMAYILYKKLRSHATTFVVNTAVADICVGVLGDIFIIIGIATNGEYLNPDVPGNTKTLCVFSSYLCASVCIVSVWSIAAASFNGYVRVCHTASYNKIFNHVTMPIMICSLWAAGILILLPTLVGWGAHHYDGVLKFCIPTATASVSYTYFMVFLGWGIPLVVILYSFGRIIWTVRASSKIMKRHSTRNKSAKGSVKDKSGSKKPRADMALIRSVAIIAFYFFAAYGFLLIILLMGDNYLGGAPSVVFAVVLAHTHCTFSGILFAGTNQRFRDAYGNMFCCISEKQAATESSSSFSSRLSKLSRFSSKQQSQQQSLVPSVSGNLTSEPASETKT
ncbi:violet-sensitive opsin-like [Amphiura filiformis]|uniref:violet-sensitive opsin-like n=1 Tax=Amphiura filiformis TaxID=82378 RepID=UPI003B20C179